MDSVSSMVDIFQKGGFVMYILLLLSVAVVAIAVERYLYFRRQDVGKTFVLNFYNLLHQKKYQEAFALARKTPGIMSEILTESTDGYLDDRHSLTSFLEVQSGIMLSRFNAKLYFLSVVVTMAPLVGLLGTITGMISAFSVLNTSAGAMAITGGVGEALIATASGIFVALVALVVHSFFKQWVEGIINGMERDFSELEAQRAAIVKAGGINHETA